MSHPDSGMTRAIAIDPRVKNPRAHEMHAHARSFVQDADLIHNPASTARIILQIHAIELALKAWLHEHGVSIEELRRKYGHNLDELVSEAKKKGLTLSEGDAEQVITRLNAAGDEAALRYNFEFHNLPMFTDITRMARAIVNDTKLPLPPLKK